MREKIQLNITFKDNKKNFEIDKDTTLGDIKKLINSIFFDNLPKSYVTTTINDEKIECDDSILFAECHPTIIKEINDSCTANLIVIYVSSLSSNIDDVLKLTEEKYPNQGNIDILEGFDNLIDMSEFDNLLASIELKQKGNQTQTNVKTLEKEVVENKEENIIVDSSTVNSQQNNQNNSDILAELLALENERFPNNVPKKTKKIDINSIMNFNLDEGDLIIDTEEWSAEIRKVNEDIQSDNKESSKELVTNNEKLVTSNEELATNNEELVSNEKLVTSNEELATNNEELVPNEKLVTSNEELVSNNEELVPEEKEIPTSKNDNNEEVESLYITNEETKNVANESSNDKVDESTNVDSEGSPINKEKRRLKKDKEKRKSNKKKKKKNKEISNDESTPIENQGKTDSCDGVDIPKPKTNKKKGTKKSGKRNSKDSGTSPISDSPNPEQEISSPLEKNSLKEVEGISVVDRAKKTTRGAIGSFSVLNDTEFRDSETEDYSSDSSSNESESDLKSFEDSSKETTSSRTNSVSKEDDNDDNKQSNRTQPDKSNSKRVLFSTTQQTSKRKFKRAKKVFESEARRRMASKHFFTDIEEEKPQLTPLESPQPWVNVPPPQGYRPSIEQSLRDHTLRLSLQRMSVMRQVLYYRINPKALSEKQKRFICNHELEKKQKLPINIVFHLSNTKYYTLLKCQPENSLQELKEIAFNNFEKMIPPGEDVLKIIDEYVLEWTDTMLFLTEEDTTLKQLQLMTTGIQPEHITFTERSKFELHKLKINQINKMVNATFWKSSLENENDEKTHFRKNVSRYLSVSSPKTFQTPHMTRAQIPPYVPPKFKVSFMTAPGVSKAVGASPNSTIGELIDEAKRKIGLPGNEDYVMKICGRKEYIFDRDAQLSKFEHVRKLLERKRDVFFTLVNTKDLNCTVDPTTRRIIPPWQQNNDEPPKDNRKTCITQNEIEELIGQGETEDNISIERPKRVGKRLRNNFGVASLFLNTPKDISIDSLWLQNRIFEIKINSVQNLVLGSNARNLNFANISLFIEVGLYYGGEPLVEPKSTVRIPWESPLVWDEVIVFENMCIKNLPRETRTCITLYGKDRNYELPLACVSLKLFDHRNLLVTGPQQAYMWGDDAANPIGFCGSNLEAKAKNQNVINLEFDEFPFPVAYNDFSDIPNVQDKSYFPTEENEKQMLQLLNMDSLWFPTPTDKKFLWKFRHWIYNNYPNHLNKLALSVPWSDPYCVKEFWYLLDSWPLLETKYALELLDARYADFRVREFAVQSLRLLNDQELSLYLLQLVQVVKYELYHFTPLSLFLLERALENEIAIGVPLFWHLRSELHIQENSERFGLILEAFLINCSDNFRQEINKQISVVNCLQECAIKVKTYPENKRTDTIRKMLSELKLPDEFTLPLDPVKELSGKIDVSKCRCFDSAKAPILVCFNSSDPLWEEKNLVIFKQGDDLRQDALTLQLLTLMDQIWKMSNLDLHMTPYKVAITGEGTGFIEVVPDSKTTAGIQKESGKTLAAFSEKPLRNWFQDQCRTQEEFMSIVDNFVLSCAGYCVATYVLGIGDRHNSNIMVDTKGHLFHIDFGHFLGNYKSWKGIWDREKAPFVLTPEFAFVMDGKDSDSFKYFIRQCVRAYLIIRKEGNFILTLFTMMLSTGIPELRSAADLLYLRDSLSQELTDEEAKDKFIQLIDQSLKCKTTQLNGFFHLLAH